MKIDSYIENLIKLGLKEPEAKVYLNLLKKKNFTATEISRLSGVPRTKIYDVLHKLINKGLCVEILGGVKKYSPANPKTAFNGLIQKYEQDYQKELELRKIIVSNMSDTIFPFYHSEKENTDPLDYIKVLREKSRIAEKFSYLVKRAKEEILAFTKRPYALNLESNEEGLTAIKKGIMVKSIYEIDDAREPDFLKLVEMFAETGEDVRVAYELPMKMMIFDNRIVMFTLENKIYSQPNITAMVIEHSDLAKTLKETFNMYWQNSMTLEKFKINGV